MVCVWSYNRTILELKRCNWRHKRSSDELIIAPFWNWNTPFSISMYFFLSLIIAPFWNWNLKLIHLFVCPICPYNRTILELKQCKWYVARSCHGTLIIAPFWNWNKKMHNTCSISSSLIIAPFWNWNFLPNTRAKPVLHSYNRTILELKHCSLVILTAKARIL